MAGPLRPFDNFIFHHNFWIKRAIFLGKYFKKSIKDCEFTDRQHNTLILIFGYVVYNKKHLIFQQLQSKKKFFKFIFSLVAQPLPHPPTLVARPLKSNFSSWLPIEDFRLKRGMGHWMAARSYFMQGDQRALDFWREKNCLFRVCLMNQTIFFIQSASSEIFVAISVHSLVN